jgi:ElaB/YqjD/DUF883 family membrane-anchored ribosome-binding protein
MDTFDKVSNFAQETADKIGTATSDAAEVITETSEQLMHVEQRLLKNCRVYVRDYPMISLGIAIGGGFLLSRLLSSR